MSESDNLNNSDFRLPEAVSDNSGNQKSGTAELRIAQLEKELAIAREDMRSIEAIMDTIRDPIIVLDKDLRVRSASKGFYTKFETSEEAVEGNLVSELKSCSWFDVALTEKLRGV